MGQRGQKTGKQSGNAEEIIELSSLVMILKARAFFAIEIASYCKKSSAKDAHLAEKKLVVNDTARARKSPAGGLFVLVSYRPRCLRNAKDFLKNKRSELL